LLLVRAFTRILGNSAYEDFVGRDGEKEFVTVVGVLLPRLYTGKLVVDVPLVADEIEGALSLKAQFHATFVQDNVKDGFVLVV
jgi:hypothetical protein